MKRLWTNAFWNASALTGGKLLVFALLVTAARVLTLPDFGFFTFIIALAQLLYQLMDGGATTAVWRETATAADGGRRAYLSALKLRIITLTIGFLPLIPVWKRYEMTGEARAFLVLAVLGMGVASLVGLRQAVLRARERLREEAFVQLTERLVYAGVGMTLLALGGGLIGLGAAFLAGHLAALWLSSRFQLFPAATEASAEPGAWHLAKLAWPLGLAGLFTAVYFRIDMVMLQKMRGAEETGLYGAAYRLIEAAMIAPAALLAAYFPRLARAAEGDAPGAAAEAPLTLLLHIATAGACFGLVFAPEIMRVFFGAPFAPAGNTLRILLFALWAIYPNYLLTQMLIARRKQRIFAVIVGGCAALNILGNLALIPRWGGNGAALATVATETLLLVAAYRFLQGELRVVALQKIIVPLHYGAIYLPLLLLLRWVNPAIGAGVGLVIFSIWLGGAWRQFNRRLTR